MNHFSQVEFRGFPILQGIEIAHDDDRRIGMLLLDPDSQMFDILKIPDLDIDITTGTKQGDAISFRDCHQLQDKWGPKPFIYLYFLYPVEFRAFFHLPFRW